MMMMMLMSMMMDMFPILNIFVFFFIKFEWKNCAMLGCKILCMPTKVHRYKLCYIQLKKGWVLKVNRLKYSNIEQVFNRTLEIMSIAAAGKMVTSEIVDFCNYICSKA